MATQTRFRSASLTGLTPLEIYAIIETVTGGTTVDFKDAWIIVVLWAFWVYLFGELGILEKMSWSMTWLFLLLTGALIFFISPFETEKENSAKENNDDNADDDYYF